MTQLFNYHNIISFTETETIKINVTEFSHAKSSQHDLLCPNLTYMDKNTVIVLQLG